MQQLIVGTHASTTSNSVIARYIAGRDTLRALAVEEVEEARQCVLERGGYSIRLADSSGQRSQASMLINRRYAWRGYHTQGAATLSRNPNRITLEASSDEQLFGTLTLGLDSEEGLFADELYQQEINAFRKRGRKVCELSKLALEPKCGSKEVLASLFFLAYVYAHIIHRATDAFVEVNPRHARFYIRMLGFRQIGEERICPRVNAPAVMLHLDFDYMDAQIARHCASCDTQERSLYPYFSAIHDDIISCAAIQDEASRPTPPFLASGEGYRLAV